MFCISVPSFISELTVVLLNDYLRTDGRTLWLIETVPEIGNRNVLPDQWSAQHIHPQRCKRKTKQ